MTITNHTVVPVATQVDAIIEALNAQVGLKNIQFGNFADPTHCFKGDESFLRTTLNQLFTQLISSLESNSYVTIFSKISAEHFDIIILPNANVNLAGIHLNATAANDGSGYWKDTRIFYTINDWQKLSDFQIGILLDSNLADIRLRFPSEMCCSRNQYVSIL